MATVRELVTEWGFDIDDRPLKRMDSSIKGIKSTLTTVGIAVGAVGALVGGVFLKQAGQFEQSQIAFETMLGSAERGQALLKDITTFAAKTPFEIQGLVESSKRLLAFGFAADKVIPTMESLGNISAGVGREKLPQLILALGQVRAATKLRGQELRQFTEAGVPLIEEIAKIKNIAEKEVQALVSKGQVSFEDVNAALANLTTGSGRFSNLMIKQSASLFGVISNLKDNFTILAIEIGQELLPAAKAIANQILDWIDANKELVKTKALRFIQATTKMVKSLFIVFEGIFRILKSVTLAFGGLEKTLLFLIKAFAAFIALKLAVHMGALIINFAIATKNILALGNAALLTWAKIFLIPLAIGAALVAIGLLIEDIVAFFQGKDSITGRLIAQMQKNFPQAIAMVKDLFGFWKEQVMLVVDVFKLIWSWMGKVADIATSILKPALSAIQTAVEAVFKVLNAAGKLIGLDFGKALQNVAGVVKGAVAPLRPEKLSETLKRARDRTSGARAFVQGITPTENAPLRQENLPEMLMQARDRTADTQDFVQGITPATTAVPRPGGGATNTSNVEIKPVITNNINGTADPEETANKVNETIEGNLEKIFREAGRDLTPAIER
jgi:tape measure domain-containing protein